MRHMVYDFIYMRFTIHRERKQNIACLQSDCLMNTEFQFRKMKNVLEMDSADGN